MSRMKFAGIAVLVAMLLIAIAPQPTTAQFVFAGWDWPDANYQGIKNVKIYENSSGSWVQVGDYYEHTNSNIIEWPAGVGIKLIVFSYMNQTLTGVADVAEGALFLRHNVTVTNRQGTSIFSQANFTYITGADYGDYLVYQHYVILNFLPAAGQAYTITITYEVYYR